MWRNRSTHLYPRREILPLIGFLLKSHPVARLRVVLLFGQPTPTSPNVNCIEVGIGQVGVTYQTQLAFLFQGFGDFPGCFIERRFHLCIWTIVFSIWMDAKFLALAHQSVVGQLILFIR